MKIFHGFSKIKGWQASSVIALGVFDGVHRGHQKVIRHAVKRSRGLKAKSVVITFDPHPVHILNPLKYCPLIVTVKHRLGLIKELGVDTVIVINFTKKFSRLGCEQFVKKYLVDTLHMCEIVVGDDFRFGCEHQGTARSLKQLGHDHGFGSTIIPVRSQGQKTISSSSVRQFISEGNLTKASRLLGRPVSLIGKVVHGDARGKRLGYPTANIQPDQKILLPVGVFVVSILINKQRYYGLANIGRRPSFKSFQELIVEVHFFNFDQNIYGKEILIEFLKKIRNERMFRCQQDLIRQIQIDEKKARLFLKKKKGRL